MNQAPTAKAEWGAHWPKVASGMIGMSFYAMLTYHFGLFIQPLQKEFGWSREAISWGLFIYTGGAFLLGVLWLAKRHNNWSFRAWFRARRHDHRAGRTKVAA